MHSVPRVHLPIGVLLMVTGCHSLGPTQVTRHGAIGWHALVECDGRQYAATSSATSRLDWTPLPASARPDHTTRWVRVDYRLALPVDGLPPVVRRRIQDRLLEWFAETPAADMEPGRVLSARKTALFADYEALLREDPDTHICYDERRHLLAEPQIDRLLVARLEWWSFLGGAHGNGGTAFLVFDADTGDAVSPDRMFRGDSLTTLADRLRDAVREARQVPAGVSLEQAGLRAADIRPDIAAVAPRRDGLLFHFDSYTIAPYSMGETRILLPWTEVAPYLEAGFKELTPAGRRGSSGP